MRRRSSYWNTQQRVLCRHHDLELGLLFAITQGAGVPPSKVELCSEPMLQLRNCAKHITVLHYALWVWGSQLVQLLLERAHHAEWIWPKPSWPGLVIGLII